jgi:hypothetical protein
MQHQHGQGEIIGPIAVFRDFNGKDGAHPFGETPETDDLAETFGEVFFDSVE